MTNIFDRMLEEREQEQSEASEGGCHTTDSSFEHAEKTNTVSPSDTHSTSVEVKQITQELLKHGYVEESKRSELFRKTITHHAEITTALEPLDLMVRIDSHRGIAFVVTLSQGKIDDEGEEWSHPLVRRQRLTLEQSLLIAILRQAFVMHEQEAGVGSRDATITVEDLMPQFLAYFEDSGSDARNESRLLNVLEQLKTYAIVSEVDKKQEVTIRPLIAHLANPESLSMLLQVLERKAKEDSAAPALNSVTE